MTVPLLQAITDIKKPTKANCLTCHVSSGGGPNNKRGDLEPAHADPPRTFDVHMASKANGGAGLDLPELPHHAEPPHRGPRLRHARRPTWTSR